MDCDLSKHDALPCINVFFDHFVLVSFQLSYKSNSWKTKKKT